MKEPPIVYIDGRWVSAAAVAARPQVVEVSCGDTIADRAFGFISALTAVPDEV